MSRGQRLGWFPLDTVMDTKIQLIEAEFGLKGFAVVIKLFQFIYGSEGYYCEFTDDVKLLFAKNNSVGCDFVSELISASIRRGIFDKGMYDRYSILTSAGIQKNYAKVANRRVCTDVKAEYLLVSDTVFSKNVSINPISVDRNEDSVDSFEHNIIEDNRIYNNIIEDNKAATAFKAYQDNIGALSSIISQKIIAWLDDVDESLIVYAIEQAVQNNKRSWSYIEAILNNHFKGGRKTRLDAESYKPKKKNKNKFLNFEQERDEDLEAWRADIIRKRMIEQGILNEDGTRNEGNIQKLMEG